MADSLAALGLELRDDALRWLAELTPQALPDGTLAARELLQAMGELEAEVAAAAAEIAEVDALQRWLTSGFFAAPEPGVADEGDEVEAVDAARSGGGPLPPAPSPFVHRGEGEWAERTDAPRPGANEFAAGTAQSPPSRTAGADSLPRRHDLADGRAVTGDAHRPAGASHPRRAPADADGPDFQGRTEPGPPSAGGIQGLAALAALAGRGGMEIPTAREDAHHAAEAIDPPRPAPIHAPREPESASRAPDHASVNADRADVIYPSAREPREAPWPSSAARSVEAGGTREVEASEGDAVRLPPRIIRRPATMAERAEDGDAGGSADAPLPIPFLSAPNGAEWDSAAGAPRADAPGVIPTLRVFGGAEPEPEIAPDARQAEWGAGEDEPRESADAFLARAARLAGRQPRPAQEIVRVASAPDAASTPVTPAVAPVPGAGTHDYPLTRSPAHPFTAIERGVEAATDPAVPDVTDLLDALASEIAHEYRRYYGE